MYMFGFNPHCNVEHHSDCNHNGEIIRGGIPCEENNEYIDIVRNVFTSFISDAELRYWYRIGELERKKAKSTGKFGNLQ